MRSVGTKSAAWVQSVAVPEQTMSSSAGETCIKLCPTWTMLKHRQTVDRPIPCSRTVLAAYASLRRRLATAVPQRNSTRRREARLRLAGALSMLLYEVLPCLTALAANLQAPCKMGSAFLPRHSPARRMCGTLMANAAPLAFWKSTTKTLAVLPAWTSFLLSIAHTSAAPVVRRTSA